jgi:hypothetical protein
MRGADGDEDAGFADLEAAKAVDDGDAMDRKFGVHLGGDFADLGEGHGLVSFVVEVERGATVRLVADAAVEGDDGAVFASPDVTDKRCRVDGLGGETEKVIAKRSHRGGSASADRRKKGDFVARVERGAPSGEFLIAGSNQRGAEAGELGMTRAVMSKELLDERAVGKLDGVFGAADDILEAAEEEHFDAHGLRSRWHKRIVTRTAGGGQWCGL